MAAQTKKKHHKKAKSQPDVGAPSAASAPTAGAVADDAAAASPARQDEAEGVRARAAHVARRARGDAGVGEGVRGQGVRRVRGPRHRRQGRHDQGDHGAGEPPGVPGRGSAGADRAREVADVRAALHPALPGRRGGRHLRSQLVQPGRRRAGHGLLHRRRSHSGSSSRCPRSRRRWSTPGSSW